VIGIVQVGAQARADRYTYLTLIGVVVGLVWLTDLVWPLRGRARGTLAAAAVTVLLSLGLVSAVQAARWRDSLTLLSHTVRVTRDNALILNNLGSALIDARRFEEALTVLREAIRIMPDHCNAHYNLAIATTSLVHSRDLLAAGAPKHGRADVGAGDPGRYRDALAANSRALECYVRSGTDAQYVADTHFNMAGIYLYLGRYAEAERHLRQLLLIDPAHAPGRKQLNIALAGQRQSSGETRHDGEAGGVAPPALGD
jgi:tetratricopeptide (TPR) repeat protein